MFNRCRRDNAGPPRPHASATLLALQQTPRGVCDGMGCHVQGMNWDGGGRGGHIGTVSTFLRSSADRLKTPNVNCQWVLRKDADRYGHHSFYLLSALTSPWPPE